MGSDPSKKLLTHDITTPQITIQKKVLERRE